MPHDGESGRASVSGEDGCCYILDSGEAPGSGSCCGRPRRLRSYYCDDHHRRCHLPSGSRAERKALRGIEKLAETVGGRRGAADGQPPQNFLRRLERAVRDFL